MDIDYEKLRSDLIDYLGTAINYYPMVVEEIQRVQIADNSSLIYYANNYHFDLNNYVKGSTYIRYKI